MSYPDWTWNGCWSFGNGAHVVVTITATNKPVWLS